MRLLISFLILFLAIGRTACRFPLQTAGCFAIVFFLLRGLVATYSDWIEFARSFFAPGS